MSKKIRSIIAAGCTAAVTTGLLLPAAAAAQAAEESGEKWIVGMGDSYMSGEGGQYSTKHIAPPDPDRPKMFTEAGGTPYGTPDSYVWSRDWMGNQVPTSLIGEDGNPVTTSDIYFDKPDGSGEQIPWCHRSPFAPSYIGGEYKTLNLACSGAEGESKVSDSGLPKPGVDFKELTVGESKIPGQAAMLANFAKTNNVEVINLSIGGNDFGFADLATQLIAAQGGGGAYTPYTWVPSGLSPEKWTAQARLDLVASRVKESVANIAAAMEMAGKSPDSYKIIYQLVPMPLPAPEDYRPQESASFDLRVASLGTKLNEGGCPVWGRQDAIDTFFAGVPEEFYSEDMWPGDAEWVADTVFPALIGAMLTGIDQARTAVGENGPQIVVNDVSKAMSGHEICSKDIVRKTNHPDTFYDYRNGEAPVFGPGQGADTEWMNAVGRGDGLLIPDLGGLTGGFETAADKANANYITQVLHPNYWGQRALAACAEAAVNTASDYIACQPHPAGGTDAKGRPLMLASAPSDFTPMAPMRAVDTRAPSESRAAGPLAAGAPVEIDLTGKIPAGTTAVSYNLTVTDQTASGYAEVAPAGAVGGSSTINWTAPLQTIANGHISKVNGTKLQVTLGGSGTAHVIIDITGAFTAAGSSPDAGGFTAVERRVHDSRDDAGPLAPGASRTLNINDDVRAMNGGPTPVAAAVNVTVTGTTGSGVLSVAKETTTTTSTINWSGTNQTIANAVITDVAEDGSFTVTNNGKTPAEIVVDLTGTFTPGTGAKFYATDPARSYDSRTSDRPLTDTRSRVNTHPVPAEAVAVAVNTTITGTTGSGWLAVTNSATTTPMTSTVNWYESPTTRANGSISGATDATTCAHVGGLGSANYLLDVAGYFQ